MPKLGFLAAWALTAAATTAGSPIQRSAQIAGGLVEGLFSDKGELKACVQGSEGAASDVAQAVRDLEKKDAKDILQGLVKLSEAFKEMPSALKACKGTAVDIEEILDVLRQIHSPQDFAFHVGKNLVVNHHDIFLEISAAVADYRSQDFEGFGVQIGMALRKLLVGSSEDKFREFLEATLQSYATAEERTARFEAFARNLEHVRFLQEMEEDGATYSHLSPFADLSPEEFSQRHGLWPRPSSGKFGGGDSGSATGMRDLPESLDWREKGAVNPIKNQGSCGSCWAFATVANIEGAGFVSTGQLVSLSEQELVDCDKGYGDEGCRGGLPSNAYKEMIETGKGLETEGDYPYKGLGGGQCQESASAEKAFIGSWLQVSSDEGEIAAALVKYGPLAIGINAGMMQFYIRGIANPLRLLCNPRHLDHGVTLVGYGNDPKDYWIIRNSWGQIWGERGYYRIVRGRGACGLNAMVTTATQIQLKGAVSPPSLVV